MSKSVLKLMLVFFAMIVLVIAIIAYTNDRMLDNSIYSLLSEKLGLQYTINGVTKGRSFTDISGEWMITLDGRSKGQLIIGKEFQLADDADLTFFKSVVRKKFLVEEDLRNYELFRSEMFLGKGTACESKYCNIYILRKKDAEIIYVGIYTD